MYSLIMMSKPLLRVKDAFKSLKTRNDTLAGTIGGEPSEVHLSPRGKPAIYVPVEYPDSEEEDQLRVTNAVPIR